YNQPLFLIAEAESLADHLRSLRSIGIDKVPGHFDAAAVNAAGLRTESYHSATVQELRPRIDAGEVTLLDVRAATEYQSGHIAAAEHQFLGTLGRNVKKLDRDKPIVTQCMGGGRSAIAA